jgi:hypothetical protein
MAAVATRATVPIGVAAAVLAVAGKTPGAVALFAALRVVWAIGMVRLVSAVKAGRRWRSSQGDRDAPTTGV